VANALLLLDVAVVVCGFALVNQPAISSSSSATTTRSLLSNTGTSTSSRTATTTTSATKTRSTATALSSATAPPETLTVTPIKRLDGTVTLPGSKSLSNRCLLLAALSDGKTRVDNLLESDDIRYMLEALDKLQVPVEKHSAESVTVTGQAGPIDSPSKDSDEPLELFLGNAGTAMRPLAAALCMGHGNFVLDGVPRMRERPIADLIEGLKQLGADVSCVEETGCPPVTIHAKGLKGGKVRTLLGFMLQYGTV
jgi:3-phosphoshikimate 1-carboxyvinyltransferase